MYLKDEYYLAIKKRVERKENLKFNEVVYEMKRIEEFVDKSNLEELCIKKALDDKDFNYSDFHSKLDELIIKAIGMFHGEKNIGYVMARYLKEKLRKDKALKKWEDKNSGTLLVEIYQRLTDSLFLLDKWNKRVKEDNCVKIKEELLKRGILGKK